MTVFVCHDFGIFAVVGEPVIIGSVVPDNESFGFTFVRERRPYGTVFYRCASVIYTCQLHLSVFCDQNFQLATIYRSLFGKFLIYIIPFRLVFGIFFEPEVFLGCFEFGLSHFEYTVYIKQVLLAFFLFYAAHEQHTRFYLFEGFGV